MKRSSPFADRPLEPKEVASFLAIVMVSTGDDGEPTFGVASVDGFSYLAGPLPGHVFLHRK